MPRTVNVTFFTFKLTENDNCKRYNEYVYSTVYYENKVNICLQYCQRSIHVYNLFSVILILVETFTVVIFGQI